MDADPLHGRLGASGGTGGVHVFFYFIETFNWRAITNAYRTARDDFFWISHGHSFFKHRSHKEDRGKIGLKCRHVFQCILMQLLNQCISM